MESNHSISSESQVTLEDFWLNHIERRNQTGLSKSAYCKERGLRYNQYLYWDHKLSSRRDAPIKLLPVQISRPPALRKLNSTSEQLIPPATTATTLCSLTLKTGAVLHIYDQAALNTLVAILR